VTIRNIKTILTAPSDINLVVVKIETSEPGLYGLGCATFTQRYAAVKVAVDEYLTPLLLGRSVENIEDIWQCTMGNSYWRNGPVLNNAISGVDEALWDIKGKMANMPVYRLLGGKCREAADVYMHADGASPEEVEENVRKYIEMGLRNIRCQMGTYGGQMNKGTKQTIASPEGALPGAYFDPKQYMKNTIKMFEHIRKTVGYDVELLHDIHERLAPIDAVRFAKDLNDIRLFFLEDALPPEQIEWFEDIRRVSSSPIAMGELFTHPLEWKGLIANRLIDFIRVHISMIGGITPAKKLAAFCETFGVRTAWHGPGDITPVGVAANLHIDLAVPNFGIQEFSGFSEMDKEVFPGCPELKNGYLYPNEKPGLGVDIDEVAAAKFPCEFKENHWLKARLPDGTSVRS
jgi:mannonate dehydratase